MKKRFAIIDSDGIVSNIAIYNDMQPDKPFVGDLPISIGHRFDGEKFVTQLDDGTLKYYSVPDFYERTQAQMREHAYQTLRGRLDAGEALILWDGEPLTVDEAIEKWTKYAAEESEKAGELRILIKAAKTYIRTIYPEISQ